MHYLFLVLSILRFLGLCISSIYDDHVHFASKWSAHFLMRGKEFSETQFFMSWRAIGGQLKVGVMTVLSGMGKETQELKYEVQNERGATKKEGSLNWERHMRAPFSTHHFWATDS